MSRRHAGQKTQDRLRQTESLAETARALLERAPGLSSALRGEILEEIDGYLEAYRRGAVERPGRLERLGVPSILVRPLRGVRRWLAQRLSDGV
jgi:hypothetical protein